MSRSVKFSVLADYHYHRPGWPSTLDDLAAILKRADENDVDFVIHAGDFCTNWYIAPELKKAWLDNTYGLPVYGIYGNHELELMNHGVQGLDEEHPMQYVTPFLTNRADEVHWGTPDGKPAAWGEVAYYWFEKNGFRFVCTDTAYSRNPETGEWVHNPTLYTPKGNHPHEALGEPQMTWLEDVLTDAAHKDIPCIVFSHCPFTWRGLSGNHVEAREIFARVNAIRKGTVLAVINGHVHTDSAKVMDNIVYFNVNSVINGCWIGGLHEHYTEEHTYTYTEYDEEGNPTKTYERPYTELWQAQHGWFYDRPLSAIVTITDDGTVTVDGCEADWAYGIVPDPSFCIEDTNTGITSGTYKMER